MNKWKEIKSIKEARSRGEMDRVCSVFRKQYDESYGELTNDGNSYYWDLGCESIPNRTKRELEEKWDYDISHDDSFGMYSVTCVKGTVIITPLEKKGWDEDITFIDQLVKEVY